MGYRLNRLDEPVFIAVSKPLLTEFGIHHRLESCVHHRVNVLRLRTSKSLEIWKSFSPACLMNAIFFFSFLKTRMGKKSEHLLLNERCGGRDLVVNDSRWKGFRGKENLGVGLPCWQCLSSIWSRWSQMKGRKPPFARDYKLNKYFKWNFKHSDKNVQFNLYYANTYPFQ